MMEGDQDNYVDLEAINIHGRFVMTTKIEFLPIVAFYDENGEDCEPEDAVTCVAGDDEFGWLTIKLERDHVTVH